jgi:hypothetical protein
LEKGETFRLVYPTTPALALWRRLIGNLTKFWVVKVESHFMDGYGSHYSAHGFYLATNPDGLTPNTNLLVIRTSLYF